MFFRFFNIVDRQVRHEEEALKLIDAKDKIKRWTQFCSYIQVIQLNICCPKIVARDYGAVRIVWASSISQPPHPLFCNRISIAGLDEKA